MAHVIHATTGKGWGIRALCGKGMGQQQLLGVDAADVARLHQVSCKRCLAALAKQAKRGEK